ncbi:hypothetical protein AcW1_009776 [Taiwanofungus camphoratus]|nr:hypothetical protein AcW1_009776 [Antrodia cinnamomea]
MNWQWRRPQTPRSHPSLVHPAYFVCPYRHTAAAHTEYRRVSKPGPQAPTPRDGPPSAQRETATWRCGSPAAGDGTPPLASSRRDPVSRITELAALDARIASREVHTRPKRTPRASRTSSLADGISVTERGRGCCSFPATRARAALGMAVAKRGLRAASCGQAAGRRAEHLPPHALGSQEPRATAQCGETAQKGGRARPQKAGGQASLGSAAACPSS